MIGRKEQNGPQGDGVNREVAFTLDTVDRHAVYAMTTGSFTQLDKEKSPPLMARDYKDPPVVGKDEPVYALDRACSIRIHSVRKSRSGGKYITIGVKHSEEGAYYANPVEHGHGGPAPAPAHPFVRPAFDVRKDEAYQIMKNILKDELLK